MFDKKVLFPVKMTHLVIFMQKYSIIFIKARERVFYFSFYYNKFLNDEIEDFLFDVSSVIFFVLHKMIEYSV